MSPGVIDELVEQAYRDHWARLLGLLAVQLRRLDLAEDCLQEAFIAAVTSWHRDGVPDNPAGWLRTTAHRKALDRLRGEATAARKLPLLIVPEATADTQEGAMAGQFDQDDVRLPDERLQLLFTCCHPALAPDGRAALMLRFVGGLSTVEIARLFLMPLPTMAARLTRAKKKIALAGIPFRVPAADQLGARLEIVLAVIYLMFTQGYRDTSAKSSAWPALAGEAIRLGRVLDEAMPGDPRTEALLALMVVQHSRRDTRFNSHGSIVLLPDQQRDRWHWDEIRYARGLLARQEVGSEPYRLQATIALEHAVGVAADTNWPRIADLYRELEDLTGSPVVRLNRAVAVAEGGNVEGAWNLLVGLDSDLGEQYQLWAVRGEFLLRMEQFDGAVAAFERALGLVTTDPERRHLGRRREMALAAAASPGGSEMTGPAGAG